MCKYSYLRSYSHHLHQFVQIEFSGKKEYLPLYTVSNEVSIHYIDYYIFYTNVVKNKEDRRNVFEFSLRTINSVQVF